MKRIFTLSAIVLSVALFLSSCVKSSIPPNSENYWLSKERGEVVYSDSYCNYFVVETYYGYTIVRAYGTYKPYEGAVVYGNFSSQGTKDMYDYTSANVFTGTITDYWLSYAEAQNALDYYCPLYGKGTTRVFKQSTIKQEQKK
jgi:hypothetical protein